MGDKTALKPLLVTAAVSLLLFLIGTYVALPVWRRARQRYAQYIPLDSLSSQTSSFRQRVQNGLSQFAANPFWRRNPSGGTVVDGDAFDDGVASEDGEELGHVDPNSRRRLAEDAQRNGPDNTGRLSRDLEEGFRDDSSDEGGNNRNSRRR
ncbi:hypothetical protein SODALDRAFT_8210 [Sodiomyces alkalinus F11]|uniref:Uncharacterized protein n=1 Tax=Sodiomyces alkalinus (strain CBS 110278 / VKM F-3762 / F11) TaxID=1314773 RepID=A0A3N2Q682_SODAK|nr:hypothetical protein SODALDRAFT_8210 [Sodiomyces alkalinus F11]ROT42135.1 hypothetical protein SODALDRAFT_8210 [Sodiomyces alkalinus F11]